MPGLKPFQIVSSRAWGEPRIKILMYQLQLFLYILEFPFLCFLFFSHMITNFFILLRFFANWIATRLPSKSLMLIQLNMTKFWKLSSFSQEELNLNGATGFWGPPSILNHTREWSDSPPLPIHWQNWNQSIAKDSNIKKRSKLLAIQASTALIFLQVGSIFSGAISMRPLEDNRWLKKASWLSRWDEGSQLLAYPKEKFRSPPKIIKLFFKRYLPSRVSQKEFWFVWGP